MNPNQFLSLLPPYLPMLLPVLAGVVLMAVVLVFRDVVDRHKTARDRRLQGLDDPEGSVLVAAAEAARADDWPTRMDRDFGNMVRRTGLEWSPQQALGLLFLVGAVAAAALFWWREDWMLSGGGLLAGMLVPLVVLLFLQRRWRHRLQQQLPDAFFLLARSLRAGLSLEQAVTLVGDQGVKPLAEEFRRAAEHARLGLTVPAALQTMANRLRLPDFSIFVAVVTLHQRIGGNLSQLLDRVAAHTRDRNQYRGQFMAATAMNRATSLVIAIASPALLLLYSIMQPEYLLRFAQNPSGQSALCVAGVLEVIGVLWIYCILRVDY
jgi:tight adherence protein B